MLLFAIVQMFDNPKRGHCSSAGHSTPLEEDGICIKEPAVQIDKADRVGEEQEH